MIAVLIAIFGMVSHKRPLVTKRPCIQSNADV